MINGTYQSRPCPRVIANSVGNVDHNNTVAANHGATSRNNRLMSPAVPTDPSTSVKRYGPVVVATATTGAMASADHRADRRAISARMMSETIGDALRCTTSVMPRDTLVKPGK